MSRRSSGTWGQRLSFGARDTLQRIGGPSALETRVIASTAILLFVLPLVTALLRGDDAARWVAASAPAAAAMVLVGVAFRMTVLPTRPRPARPVVALTAYVACGLARDLTFDASAEWAGVSGQFRTGGVITLTITYMVLAALNSSHAGDARAAVGALRAERHRLDQLVATFDERVAQADREIAAYVHAELDPAIRDIEELLRRDTAADSSVGDEAQLLTSTVSEIVRPMSHRLMDESGEWVDDRAAAPALATAPATSMVRGAVRRSVDVPATIRPLLVTLLLVALIRLPGSATESGQGLESLAVVAIVLYIAPGLLLAAMRRWWPARFRMMPLPVAWIVLIAAYGVAAYLPRMLAMALHVTDEVPILAITGSLGLPPTVMLEIVVGMSLSLMTMSTLLLAQTQTELAQVNHHVHVTVSRLRKRLWMSRRNLSWILHGPIQSALVSAALALTSAQTPIDREQIRRRILQSVKAIETSQPAHQSLEFALAETASVWSYSCGVTYRVDPDLAVHLADEPATSIALAEIIREAVGNAIRHGGATSITIDVGYAHQELARVRIVDNGHGPAADAAPGLGSRILDETTYRWTLTTAGTGAVLSADVALG